MSIGQPSHRVSAASCAASGHPDTRTAALEIADQLTGELGTTPCDAVFLFASYHHRAALPHAAESIARTINPGVMIAVTAEAVVGAEEAFENSAGMTALAMRIPGAVITPWWATPEFPLPLRDPEGLRHRLHVTADSRASLIFCDPFSTPITRLLPALHDALRPTNTALGGAVASGASQAGQNVLIADQLVLRAGSVGVTLDGRVRTDFLVSQGCRPIGQPHVVTKVRDNIILELGGRPTLEVMQQTLNRLEEREKPLLANGLLLGHVIDEHKRPFGRGDFLVRILLGVDHKKGGIVVGDVPRVGQTVQFHVRDAVTATEDLQLLLDAEVLENPPLAALLLTCNARSVKLFGQEGHDIREIRRRLGPIPLAGMFAAGEIGPVGSKSFLHGHTACLVLFRSARS